MTAQVSDAFVMNGRRHAIVDSTGAGWWTPEAHGLHPEPISSACWRGYIAEYTIANGQLNLATLHLGDLPVKGPRAGPALIATDETSGYEVARAALSRRRPCVIGSGSDCDLRLDHPAMAPRHVVVGDRDTLELNNVLVTDLSTGAMYGGASRDGRVAIDLDTDAGSALWFEYREEPPRPFRGAVSLDGAVLVVPGHRVTDYGHAPPPAPTLFGVRPARSSSGAVYAGLAVPVPFTGGVVLGADFIRELYVHNGFPPSWKYRHVLELIFERGRLTAAHDRSATIAALRAEVGSDPLASVPAERMRRVFALDYSR